MGLGIPTWAVSAINAITSSVGGAWKFVQNCLSDLGNCVNKILEMANDAGMNIPTWGKNIVKSLKALRRRRQLGDSYDTHVERRRLNPLITGWDFVKNCLTNLDEAASKLLIMAKDAKMGLPAWGVNIVKSLKAAMGRRRLETDSFQNVMLGTETHENHQATSTRRRLNPLITGWNFVKNCLTNLDEAASKLLILAKDVNMGLPAWGVNIVKSLKAAIGRRRLETESFKSVMLGIETHDNHQAIRRRLNPLLTGWNFIKDCLTDLNGCASNILVLAEDANVGLPAWGVNVRFLYNVFFDLLPLSLDSYIPNY